MRMSRSAVLSLVVVVAVALAAFASASFAVQGVTTTGDVLTDDIKPVESLRMSGAVKVDDRRGDRTYKMSFQATLRMHRNDAPIAQGDDTGNWPDVVIHQSIRYPVPGGDQVEFVGPVGLPFDSEELALRIGLLGACFDADGRFVPDTQVDARCSGASLTLGDETFDVGDLLTAVDGRVWRTGRDGATVKMKLSAAFADPGYPFPITSLGDGSTITVMFGPFGGTTEVGRVSFSG